MERQKYNYMYVHLYVHFVYQGKAESGTAIKKHFYFSSDFETLFMKLSQTKI